MHEPTFLYRATVGEFVASGQGQSKKKAKHMAARAVLDQLLGQQAASPLVPAARPAALAELPLLPCEDDTAGNPVGRLQELCMSRRWPPPTYELVHEEGQPHERTFTIACCIGSKAREIGTDTLSARRGGPVRSLGARTPPGDGFWAPLGSGCRQSVAYRLWTER